MGIGSAASHKDECEDLDYLLRNVTDKILQFVSRDIDQDSNQWIEYRHLSDKVSTSLDLGPSHNLQNVLEQVDMVLQSSVNTWNLNFMEKLYGSTNPVGLLAEIVLGTLNANSHVYSAAPVLTLIEKITGKRYANLFFRTENCGGLTFPGGSYSNITSMNMARTAKIPQSKTEGVYGLKLAVMTSEASHYSIVKSAILCGLGSNNVFKIATNRYGEMDAEDLELQIEKAILNGYTPFYVNATAGTTVYGAFDPLVEIGKIARKFNLWFHVDASLGGNFIFSDKLRLALDGCEAADSITVNPHKLLGVPLTCSFLLVKDNTMFKHNSVKAQYLFHDEEDTDLGDGTLGCGRRPDAFKMYLSWYFYGSSGFKRRVEHAKALADYFANSIERENKFVVINRGCKGDIPGVQVCFHCTGEEIDDKKVSLITRCISKELRIKGKLVIDFAGERLQYLRAVFLNPKLCSEDLDKMVVDITQALEKVLNNHVINWPTATLEPY